MTLFIASEGTQLQNKITYFITEVNLLKRFKRLFSLLHVHLLKPIPCYFLLRYVFHNVNNVSKGFLLAQGAVQLIHEIELSHRTLRQMSISDKPLMDWFSDYVIWYDIKLIDCSVVQKKHRLPPYHKCRCWVVQSANSPEQFTLTMHPLS